MGFLRDNRHPNRKRLEENQKENLDLIEQVISRSNSNTINVEDNLEKIDFNNFSAQSVTETIMQLNNMRDEARNIKLYTVSNDDGSKHLVRDAREVKPVSTVIEDKDPRSVLAQMASSTRAALYMIDQYKRTLGEDEYNKVKGRLNILFNEEIKKFDANNPGDIKALKDYNANILHILTDKDSKLKDIEGLNIKQDIGTTMHAMNFLNDSYHISTISSGPKDTNSTIIESNAMLLGITDEQKRQLVALKSNDIITLKNLDWYQKLSPYEQNLARFSASQMLNDKDEIVKPVPTQLRNLIPFAKNAYCGVSYLKQGDNEAEVTSVSNRSGAVYYGRKSDDIDKLNVQTVKQLNSFTPTNNTPIIQVNLTSPNNPTGHEREMTRQIKKAFALTGNFSSTTPFNLLRKAPFGTDTNGYQHFLNKLAEVNSGTVPKLKDVSNYLKTGNGKQAALKVLMNEYKTATKEQRNYLDTMKVAVDAKSLMSKRILFYESFGNDNLKLFEYFSELNTAIHEKSGSIRKVVDKSIWNAKTTLPKMLNEISASVKDNINETNAVSNYLENKVGSNLESAKLFINNARNNSELKNDKNYIAYINMLEKTVDTKEKLNQLSKIENTLGIETLKITNRDSIKDLITVRNYALYGKGNKQEAIDALTNCFEKNPKINLNNLINAIEDRALLDEKNIKKITVKTLASDLQNAITDDVKIYTQQKPIGDHEKVNVREAKEWYEDMPYLGGNCASGKDRRGIAAQREETTGVARKLGYKSDLAENYNAKTDKTELSNLVDELEKISKQAGHQQTIPAQNDAGTHGVMPNSSLAETCSKENSLTCETARTNKFSASKNSTVNLEDLDKVFQANQQATKDQHGPYTNSATKEHVQEMNEKQNKGNPDKKQTKEKSGLTK